MLELLDQLRHFLTPQFQPLEPLQVAFFTIIFGFAAYTCIGLRHAKPENWERNWHREAGDDAANLDIEHGSVNDLCAAVATKQEKLADIMPGMLLIVGLLGTFIGLGMALDKASMILSDASGGGNVDAMMGNLMSMMHGLGSKFKTSTWGIAAFLILKTWSSGVNYDGHRLSWCVAKMKGEVDRRHSEARNLQQEDNARIVDAIGMLGSTMKQIAELQANVIVERHLEMLEAQKHAHKQQIAQLSDVADESKKTRDAMESFVDGVSGSTAAVADAAKKMAKAAADTVRSTNDLQSVIGELHTGVSAVIGDMNRELGKTIDNMGHSFAEHMNVISERLGGAANDISSSINRLSSNVDETLQGVKKSIEDSQATQTKAFVLFNSTSTTLEGNIEAMTGLVTELRKDITNGLGSVATTGQKIAVISTAIVEASEKTVMAIGKTVEDSKAISSDLGNATSAMQGVAIALQKNMGQDDLVKAVNSIDRQVSDLLSKASRPAASRGRPTLDA